MDFPGTSGSGFSSGKKSSGSKSGFSSDSSSGTGIDSGGIVGGITGAIGTLGDIIIGGLNLEQQQKNYEQQKKQLKYSKNLQKQIFEREDNAVLRRTLDLKRAGLNPILAAGSSADAGAIVKTEAPQKDMMQMPKLQAAQVAMALMQQESDISKTKAEERYIKQQTKTSAIKELTDWYEYHLMKESGQSKSPGWMGSIIKSLIGASSGSILDPLKEKLAEKAQQKERERLHKMGSSGSW